MESLEHSLLAQGNLMKDQQKHPRRPTSEQKQRRPAGPTPRSQAKTKLDGPIPKGPRSGTTRRMTLNMDGKPKKIFHETICKVLDQCQSCPMLEIDYRDQLVLKTNEFRKKLTDSGLTSAQTPVPECLPSPDRFGYRHSAKLVVNDRVLGEGRRFVNICLYKPGTHMVVDVGSCPVQHERINKILNWLQGAIKEHNISVYDERTKSGMLRYVSIRTAFKSKDTLVTLVVAEDDKLKLRPFARAMKEQYNFISGVLMHLNNTTGNAIFQYNTEPEAGQSEDNTTATTLLAGSDHMSDSVANIRLRISATSFFQINPAVAERAYFRLMEWLSPKPGETALDVYCGVGSLALLMAKAGCRVTAIEETPSSIADAHENAIINSLQHVQFHVGRAEDVLPKLSEQKSLVNADVVTLNPSRRGCQPEVLKSVAALGARAIGYMSCNPESLVRDLAILETLGYTARGFELYDMFPGSRHYEVVTLLTRT